MDANTVIAIASVVVALASAIIGGCALWLSKQADKRNEKQARLSVKPLLQIVSDKSDPILHQWLEFKIINQGLGPAIIKNFILKFDDKELTRNNYNSHISKVKEKLGGRGIEGLDMGFFIRDSVIKAEESNLLLKIEYNAEEYDFDCLNKIDILVEYYSIYKDEIFTCSIKDIRIRNNSKSQ